MLWLKKNGKKHGGYERFRTTNRDRKGAYSKILEVAGRPYQCFGPFTTTIQLDGLDMRIPIYITTNDEFGGRLTLGRRGMETTGKWQPSPATWTDTKVDLPTVDHPIDANSRTELLVRGMRFKVLVDTCAGPSCMARHVYTAVGGLTDRLHTSRRTTDSSKLVPTRSTQT